MKQKGKKSSGSAMIVVNVLNEQGVVPMLDVEEEKKDKCALEESLWREISFG